MRVQMPAVPPQGKMASAVSSRLRGLRFSRYNQKNVACNNGAGGYEEGASKTGLRPSSARYN